MTKKNRARVMDDDDDDDSYVEVKDVFEIAVRLYQAHTKAWSQAPCKAKNTVAWDRVGKKGKNMSEAKIEEIAHRLHTKHVGFCRHRPEEGGEVRRKEREELRADDRFSGCLKTTPRMTKEITRRLTSSHTASTSSRFKVIKQEKETRIQNQKEQLPRWITTL
jgi:hypothetical protein